MKDLLVGRRAVYARRKSHYDDATEKMVEDSRELYRGTIAALVVGGESRYAAVVMLYDDGSLQQHPIETVTLENASDEGPLR